MTLTSLGQRFHKIRYYGSNALRGLIPAEVLQSRRHKLLAAFKQLPEMLRRDIEHRVNYYNRLQNSFQLCNECEPVGRFSGKGKSSAYANDFRSLIRYFPRHRRVGFLFGDVTHVPEQPRFVKSRPITRSPGNANSVLLKLNTVRHYRFYQDRTPFADKIPRAVWRGKSNREHRIEFARQFAAHPLCDIGCTLHKEPAAQPWHKSFLSVAEQLKYQFVVSVEGIDVATNLKWIMASNSLCMMRRPTFETWFMEGTLVPGVHYVELADDHSDLPDKILYYRQHPAEAEAIITNAQRHVAQFLNPDTENLVALLVMEKYFQLSGQTVATHYPANA